ncbi:hypothetical protein B0A69_10385 [Chryseobacterium shigense]|uniref:Uncharacterized protein n=1 Tax=Chryseobacterium shigense TaxID=297244 RepID=A0A1N7HXZ6_9FLAO|nr:hypothetical protein [Chryseobacterium shigense]PQA93992.1 hypothetical protein B0A69_10385 [Chryseobacterium shigense]SIS29608.1 hypothetical protein SAMN05421639_101555 [Chryseobacterium shigense]
MIKNEFYNNFFIDIESIFSIEKLTKDLLDYIEGCNVSSVHEFTETLKIHKIEESDTISISEIFILKKYQNQIFLPYQVNIIVGNFDSSFGLLLMDKFKAEMSYDLDFELVTVDFIHNVD